MKHLNDTSSADWCLAARGITVRRGGRAILDEVSLQLRRGECLSLVGPNGSGKTTLMLTLLGVLRTDGGRVSLDDHDLTRLDARRRGRFAGYVPQLLDQAPAFTVYDVVAGGRYAHTGAWQALRSADETAIKQALDRCGLTDFAARRFDTLSGGERQKALIAAAIAQDPQVLMLDEPNAALDPAYQLELVRILRDWHASGRALLVISHDLQLPLALGGRVVALRDGQLAVAGTVGDVLTPAKLTEIYDAPFEQVTTSSGQQIPLPAWW